MKIITGVVYLLAAAMLSTSPSYAKNEGKLPDGAVPLSAEKTRSMYSGNTIDWKPARMYWAPDGTAAGYYPEKGKEAFGQGTWKASGNKVCYTLEWRSAKKSAEPYRENVCNEFYLVGKKLWTKNITNSENQYVGDIYTGHDKKMLKGDKATKKAIALKAKLGY